MVNNYCYVLLCHLTALCISNHACHGQEFVRLYDLISVQMTDKLDESTADRPITNGVRISWSSSPTKYRIHSNDNNNIETFHTSDMRKIFMAGDVVKIVVLDTEHFWECQFPSAKLAREFYHRDDPRVSTNNLPYFHIEVVYENAPLEQQTSYDVALYMSPYGLPQNNHRMFILKPSPRTSQNQQSSNQSLPIFMTFLSGRFSVEKRGEELGLTFLDAGDRSCTMFIRDDGKKNVQTVFDAISPYARAAYSEANGWVNNIRNDGFD